MRKTTCKGEILFMNLMLPEICNSLHDALKDNEANIFFCCDPYWNGPNDYHIISSPDHEESDMLKELLA